ncbi:MAG: hypothetical protein KF900_12745 [Bacteroidetes bacterium]|nr:hypothetical protein [Bacteroidota bacterium]
MNGKIYAITHHKLFAWIVYVAIAVFFCWDNSYFPSFDGATHYDNALLLKEYFFGNETIHTHFVLTPFYIPNIFSHYVLAVLFAVFSFKTSLLLFFFSYFVLYLHAANYLLTSYKVNHSLLFSLALSVFFYSHLVTLGFHNFMWSCVFLFYAVGFYNVKLKHKTEAKNKPYVLFFLILMLLYYANALAFLFLCLFLCLDVALHIKNTNRKHVFKLALSLLIPCIFLLLFYFNKNPEYTGNTNAPDYAELTNALFQPNCLINYSAESEKPYNTVMLSAMAALIISALYVNVKHRDRRVMPSHLFFVMSVFALTLYYVVPDDSSVGMMSMRFMHFFYVFLLLWLLLQANTGIKYLAVLVLVFAGLKKYAETAPKNIASLNQSAEEIIQAASAIEANSSVIAFNCSKNWLHVHFAEYIGVEKPLVLVYNPEVILGWFPLEWNEAEKPNYMFNHRLDIPGVLWQTNGKGAIKKPDYVFLFGETENFKSTADYTDEVKPNYSLVYKTESGFIEVYALNKIN